MAEKKAEKKAAEPVTYVALEKGTTVEGFFIEAGQTFTTSGPAGSWMEKVETKKAK